MSLSLLTPRLVSGRCFAQLVAIRASSGGAVFKAGDQSLKISQPGFFKYERDISRDKKYSNPQKPGDLPSRFLLRKLGHAYEIYPLFILTGLWFVLFCYVVYYSFEKTEIWLDRSHSVAPWDWERSRENYWKKPTLAFDSEGVTKKRVELMEILQDEMVAAAKQRGTR
ncbi:unnamed protein product [Auanema sp. JU1783]|nr:unnamed protein product [Auanema sp. JU1783]